jgi:hypothetical protein
MASSEMLCSLVVKRKYWRHVRNEPEEIARTMGTKNGGPHTALDDLK